MSRRPKAPTRSDSPFASLAALKDTLPGMRPCIRAEDFPLEPPPSGPARAVVRLESGGIQGLEGVEVTVVEGLGLPPETLEQWLLALQRGLGCYGQRHQDRLVFPGDLRRQLPDLLLRRGVQRVSRG